MCLILLQLVIPIVSPKYPPTIKPIPIKPNIIIKKATTLPMYFSSDNDCNVVKTHTNPNSNEDIAKEKEGSQPNRDLQQ